MQGGLEGLDLPNRHGEVRAMLLAHWGQRIRDAELDPDDCAQEVLLRILIRQDGKSRYDPRRNPTPSCWSNYIWITCRSVMSHLLERGWRHKHQTEIVPDPYDHALRHLRLDD